MWKRQKPTPLPHSSMERQGTFSHILISLGLQHYTLLVLVATVEGRKTKVMRVSVFLVLPGTFYLLFLSLFISDKMFICQLLLE